MQIELSNINKIKHASIEVVGLTVITGINDSGKSTVGKALFCAIKALSSSEGDSFEYKTRIVRECINTHLKSNNGTALINDAFQRAIDSEFIQNICTEGAEQSSVILSDETGQCLFTIQDNQVVRSFKDESFYLPLVYCKDFDRFIL